MTLVRSCDMYRLRFRNWVPFYGEKVYFSRMCQSVLINFPYWALHEEKAIFCVLFLSKCHNLYMYWGIYFRKTLLQLTYDRFHFGNLEHL